MPKKKKYFDQRKTNFCKQKQLSQKKKVFDIKKQLLQTKTTFAKNGGNLKRNNFKQHKFTLISETITDRVKVMNIFDHKHY